MKPEVTIKNKQSRETGNIWVHKTQDEDKKQHMGTQDTGRRQKTTYGYTRHRTKTKTKHNTSFYSNADPTKHRGEPSRRRRARLLQFVIYIFYLSQLTWYWLLFFSRFKILLTITLYLDAFKVCCQNMLMKFYSIQNSRAF